MDAFEPPPYLDFEPTKALKISMIFSPLHIDTIPTVYLTCQGSSKNTIQFRWRLKRQN
jgi:hypothetical protein